MYLINISNIWTAENDNSFLFTHRVLGFFLVIFQTWLSVQIEAKIWQHWWFWHILCSVISIFPIFITIIGIKTTDGCFGDPITAYVMTTMSDVYMIWSGNSRGDTIYSITEWSLELWNETYALHDHISNLVLDDICL